MAKHGFTVTKHYLGLDTAWRAEYTHIGGGRVLGINAEMDALPLGHACGHNLIAMSGAGVAVAVKTALETHNLPGKIVILGTPGTLNFLPAQRKPISDPSAAEEGVPISLLTSQDAADTCVQVAVARCSFWSAGRTRGWMPVLCQRSFLAVSSKDDALAI